MGETEKTSVTTDISTNCVNCIVSGGIRALLDGNPSTKFVLEATTNDDIKSDAIHINVDVRYDIRKTHLNHLAITSGGNESFHPSKIRIMARNEVHESWTHIHEESTLWAGREEKKQIMFNNHNSFFEYRLMFMKKPNTKKLEIADCNIINMITSSLAAVTYYKITDTMLFSPSTVKPKQGFMIGMVNNPSKNFIISLNITPRGMNSYAYSNIYTFKDDPISGNKQSGLSFGANSYRIDSVMKVKYGFERYGFKSISAPNQNSLAQNVESTVATKLLGDDMTLYVNGIVVGTRTVNYAYRFDSNKLYAFVSNNLYAPANAEIKGLRFINLKND